MIGLAFGILAVSGTAVGTGEYAISVAPSHPILPPCDAVNLEIKVLENKKAIEGGDLRLQVVPPEGAGRSVNFTIDKSGLTPYRFEAPADAKTGIYKLAFSYPPAGIERTIYLEVVSKDVYAEFDKAAQAVKFKTFPVHLLFLGDSLTENYWGYNYVAKVNFWLQKIYGSRVTVRNAGVGGSETETVLARMNDVTNTYGFHEYDHLFEPKPTHVFIFLGHNDSKLGAPAYTNASIQPGAFERDYRLIIRIIQQETQARVIVMSTASLAFEICKAEADAKRAKGIDHNLFGKPEALEQYNAIARKVANETGALYLDVYKPMRVYPNKPNLFDSDGVHINNNGNRVVALEILKFLADSSK
jgi:lysophospholipase L1-like esterase